MSQGSKAITTVVIPKVRYYSKKMSEDRKERMNDVTRMKLNEFKELVKSDNGKTKDGETEISPEKYISWTNEKSEGKLKCFRIGQDRAKTPRPKTSKKEIPPGFQLVRRITKYKCLVEIQL